MKGYRNRKRTGARGMTALLLAVTVMLSVLACAAGCADNPMQMLSGEPHQSTQDGVVSDSGATTAEPTDIEIEIPMDHEDVTFADYISDYYIVVYTLNNSVLVLSKDDNGKYNNVVKTFICSAGALETPTTNGVYSVVEKHNWRFMMEVYGHYCTRIGKGTGYLFHSVPYNKEGVLNSQTGGYNKLGQNASHGCIRLCARDAKWVYDNIPLETQVHIVEGKNGPPGEPVPQRSTDGKYWGWDPTDPDKSNPYIIDPPEDVTYFTHTSHGTQATTAFAGEE